jgi:hypothetical protein
VLEARLVDERSAGQRRADALVEVCRLVLRTGELPESGGEPPQVSVVVRFAPLAAQVRAVHQGRGRQPHLGEASGDGSGNSSGGGAGGGAARGADKPWDIGEIWDPGQLSGTVAVRDIGEPPGAGPASGTDERLGVGVLDTGLELSPATVRRLACDAKLIPVVLGGQGQVLDVGLTRRLYTGPARRALVLRDGGCAFPGCDRPPRWCDAHHIRHWADGGPTTLDNGVLLCGHHHRVIHHEDWQVRLGSDRMPEFIPPAYIDRDRRPRRNTYHQR